VNRHVGRDDANGIEAHVDALDRAETPNQYPRTDEQHDRERRLRDDQSATHSIAAQTAGVRSRRLL
jgi:hypothetical protein